MFLPDAFSSACFQFHYNPIVTVSHAGLSLLSPRKGIQISACFNYNNLWIFFKIIIITPLVFSFQLPKNVGIQQLMFPLFPSADNYQQN